MVTKSDQYRTVVAYWCMATDDDYRLGRHVVSALHVDLVFLTKYRRGALDDVMLTRCEQVMREVCKDFGARLAQFNGEHDHVRLLVEYPPKVAVSALVNSLKGVSSRRLRQDFAERVNRVSVHGRFWSPDYFAASGGAVPISIICQYIEQQRRPG